jgi:predicted Zn-dependent peptidase
MKRYTLSNGLTVVNQSIDSAVSLSIGLWFKVGSRDELPSQYGYAHFTEHMLFKGTAKRSAVELAREIDRVGGQHNAGTNKEYTCFYINIVADHMDLALDILSDMYYNSSFDPVEIEREKQVIVEEIRLYEDSPDEHVHDMFMYSVFNGHPLGHHILGTEETVCALTRESLVDFYDTHFYDENAIISISGKFDEEKLSASLEKYFYKSRKPKESRVLPVAEDNRIYRHHVERNLEQIHFCLGVEGFKKKSEHRWAVFLLSTILGGSMSSRLFQKIREEQALCYSVYSFHSFYQDRGLFGIYCGTSPEKYEKALQLILDELSIMVNKGIVGQELEDAKTFMKGNLALSLESNEIIMGKLARDEIQYGKYFPFDEIIRNVNSVTNEEFLHVAEMLLTKQKMSLVTVGPLESVSYRDIILST